MCPVDTQSIWKSSTRLADGREIVYFDEAPGLCRAQVRTFLPSADQCPLDPSAPGRPTEVPTDSYDVVVFENRFPSLREPLGRCEVICFTSDHDSSFAALSPRRVRTVFEAWVDRTEALSALPETRQVYCFENRGEEIGVTLRHPHGQIYAFPFVTPRTERMV